VSKGKFTCTACEEDFVDMCVNLVCPAGYHYVASTHPDDVEDNDDPVEQGKAENFELGQISAREGFGPRLRQLAGACFAEGKDTDARRLRDLAEVFEKEAADLRRDHQRKYGGVG